MSLEAKSVPTADAEHNKRPVGLGPASPARTFAFAIANLKPKI